MITDYDDYRFLVRGVLSASPAGTIWRTAFNKPYIGTAVGGFAPLWAGPYVPDASVLSAGRLRVRPLARLSWNGWGLGRDSRFRYMFLTGDASGMSLVAVFGETT